MPDALDVRYRPRRFSEVVGQRHACALLRTAVNNYLNFGELPPTQLLFQGPSGTGKTTLARIYAAALLCTTPFDLRPQPGDACGECDSCASVWSSSGGSASVIELDAASNAGKDEIKELARHAYTRPLSEAAFKVYIIDEAHGMTPAGNQAFLKLLEEPPRHVIFALATTDPEKLAQAVRSRCTPYELSRPANAEMARNLVRIAENEGWDLDDDVALAIVRSTDPLTGVRGTVKSLAKLSPILVSGEELTVSRVEENLGSPASELMNRLTSAISSFDSISAFAALDGLRAKHSEKAIRSGVLAWAQEKMHEDINAGTRPGLSLWRYEQILSAKPGEAWTDVLVARLSSPYLDPAPATQQALLDEAEKVARSLTETLRRAK